jgi:hypothetical protein
MRGKITPSGRGRAAKAIDARYANEHRPWQLYETVFHNLLKKCEGEARYAVVESRPVPENGNIIRDEVILLTSQQETGPEACLRRH